MKKIEPFNIERAYIQGTDNCRRKEPFALEDEVEMAGLKSIIGSMGVKINEIISSLSKGVSEEGKE